MSAMRQLGLGLCAAGHYKDALSVNEADLATLRRIGAPEVNILDVQGNLSINYEKLGRLEDALRLKRDVYSGSMKLSGEEDESTLLAANNYANILNDMQRHAEARELLRKSIPVARRALKDNDSITLKMRWLYARALYADPAAPLDNLREAVATLESVANSWKQILGPAHPETPKVQAALQEARETLAAGSA